MKLGVAFLWAMSAGFAAGVFMRSLVVVPESWALSLGVAAILALLAGLRDAKTLRYALVVCSCMLAFGAGLLRMQFGVLEHSSWLDAHIGDKVTLEGRVADEPDVRATQVRVPIAMDTYHAKLLAIFPAHTELYYGEHVEITGTLVRPQSFDTGTGRQFNYPGYLASQGITYELDRATLGRGGDFEGNYLVAAAYNVKDYFVQGLVRALPEPHAGLAGGITVGDKRALGKDLTKEFQTVSLVHIIVLSGYNITIVISALFWVLGGAPRAIRFGAGGFVALFFAVMTGFASASLRAALMALIAVSGKLTGRIYRADRALALVSTLMIAWNPYLLVFDTGFQLSFLACAGLLVFSPVISRWCSSVPQAFGVQEILVSTSSAQIAVLPLLLYESGTLSLVSLPANLLVLAAVPPAMLFSAVAAVGGMLVSPLAPIIGFPAYTLLSYILLSAHVLSHIPFASVTVPAFSAWLLVPIYAALFGFGLYGTENKKPPTSNS